MSKRKSSRTCEEDLEHLLNKVRKLERKMRERDRDKNSSPPPPPAAADPSPPFAAPPSESPLPIGTHVLDPTDWISQVSGSEPLDPIDVEVTEEPFEEALTDTMATQEGAGTASVLQPQSEVANVIQLDADALEILGEDPSVTEKQGNAILQELACRLQHIATEGLDKENRKELTSKYPIPANCLHINAPKINPEIKVAIPENIAKRDKGLETKQKQMANAISCLGDIITTQINSKDKNKEMLQKLMDLGRILCDLQHGDSITRRNFILFALKKDLKEHLNNAKIDSFLFSETLSDTLKSAKTINKSGIELKADSNMKNAAHRPKQQTHKNLNRKAPGPAYRPPGLPARSYQPTAPRAALPPPPPPPPPAHSSRMWPRPPAPTAGPRRRY